MTPPTTPEQPWPVRTVARKIAAVKSFCHFLEQEGLITEDPTAATDFPTCRPGTVPHTNLSLLLRGPAGAEMLAK